MSNVRKLKHKLYQEIYLDLYRTAMDLSKNATLTQVIDALVETKQFNEATELLFGGEREQVANHPIEYEIFMNFWAGYHPDLLKEVAKNHFWSQNIPSKGFAIRVYLGEFFVIKEPTATKVLRATQP